MARAVDRGEIVGVVCATVSKRGTSKFWLGGAASNAPVAHKMVLALIDKVKRLLQ